ncbi:MAG: hypothetical protein PHQ47_00620 [Candidatus Portnoybacteria bacterium]|nr:hypothetical protein [Candidatus Portnoybacteria bacterium]
MDILEKKQTIEAVKTIVKGRWFLIGTILSQAIIITFFLEGVSVASLRQLSVIAFIGYAYNFAYWFYLRRSPEKISDWGLKTVKAMQFFVDLVSISVILFLSGTTDKTIAVLYFISLSVCISLYGKKGVIVAAFCTSLFFSALVFLEFYGFLPDPPIRGGIDFISAKNNQNQLIKQLIVFNNFIIAAVLFLVFMGNLFRRREKGLIDQRNDLVKKTKLLTDQSVELTETKNWLHEALVKSDAARIDLQGTKEQLERTNFDLREKIEELEKMTRLTTGRELRMVELKKQIEKLKDQDG